MREPSNTGVSLRYLTGAAAVAMCVVLAWEGLAQSSAANQVTARQDEMKKMGSSFKVVMPVVKGESTDLSATVGPLTGVNEYAKKIPASFPQGTGREAVAESRAKPEVWSERAAFEAAATKLADESAKLLAAAKANDLAGFKEQFKAYSAACGGCHDGPSKSGGKFRIAKE